ncbi:MAG: aspartyl protease family protein [Pseudomonadota bacterium]
MIRFDSLPQKLRSAACLAAALLVWPCLILAEASEERTLTLQDNLYDRPLTSVMVNGASSVAILDTGATIALIDEDLLGFDETSAKTGEEAEILGIGGKRIYPIMQVESLAVGSERWAGLRVAVNTANRFPVERTVLPISIFDARVVDFDFRKDRLHLYDSRPRRVREADKSVVRYKDVQGLIFIPIRINGVRGKALIDTGADMSFVNPAYAHLAKASIDFDETKRIRGSDLSTSNASVYAFRSLRFGDNEITRFKLPVLKTELFAELGFGDEPLMVMGMDILKQFRLQVDRERGRVSFVLPQDRNQG